MNTTALFLSAALGLFSLGQEVDPQTEPEPTKSEQTDELTPHPVGEEAIISDARIVDSTAQDEAAALQAREIARVQAWFNSVDTLQARFEQTAPDRSVTHGTLLLDRPGRARFDYDDPTPILLVADGANVAIADFQLETIDRVPIGATPLAPLLAENQDLAASGAVTEAGRYDDRLYLSLVDPEGESDGRLTLVFLDADVSEPAESMVFEGWYAQDALGGMTQVNLSEVQTGIEIDPRQFILDDEDVLAEDDRRRGRRR